VRLTTKAHFAVTAMLDIALQAKDLPVALSEISARQKISLAYLEQLFIKLRRHALVVSVRGARGGYCLAKPTDCISIADIINAVDESIDATQCAGKTACNKNNSRCMTHDLWANLNKTILQYLASITLYMLIHQQQNTSHPLHTAYDLATNVSL
jgi:Rrf2 family iron-sulfur cluster assembly transcriptional regulator